MSFKTRIFLVMLMVNTALAVGLLFFFRSSVESGFWRYVQAREIRQVQPFITALAAYYTQHGNWQGLIEPGNAWQTFIRSHHQHDFEGPPPGGGPDGHHEAFRTPPEESPGNGPKKMPPEPLKPLVLLDAQKHLLAGKTWREKDLTLLVIEANGQLVGYLGLPTRPDIRDYQAQGFIRDQLQHMLLITLLALVVAGLVALLLSTWLSKRIEMFVAQVRAYSLGRYEARLNVQGRDELQILARHLNDLGDSLRKAEQTRKQWVADISHELRTPLAVLQADLEALEDGVRVLDDAAVQRLQNQVLRLNRLVEDLYDLSLSDIGALSYRKTQCDVAALTQECVHMLQLAFNQAGLEFHYMPSLPADLVMFADGQRLSQLLCNLLNNALKYTHAPGRVELRLSSAAGHVQWQLDDSAPGVPENLREKLFERFFRAESSRNRNSGGAGLGLSLCKNIVAAHQGEISLHASPLGGLRVIVRLPME